MNDVVNMAEGARAPRAAPPVPKLAYRLDEVAEATGLGLSSIYLDLKSGALAGRKRGRATIVLAADLDAYLASLPKWEGE